MPSEFLRLVTSSSNTDLNCQIYWYYLGFTTFSLHREVCVCCVLYVALWHGIGSNVFATRWWQTQRSQHSVNLFLFQVSSCISKSFRLWVGINQCSSMNQPASYWRIVPIIKCSSKQVTIIIMVFMTSLPLGVAEIIIVRRLVFIKVKWWMVDVAQSSHFQSCREYVILWLTLKSSYLLFIYMQSTIKKAGKLVSKVKYLMGHM